MLTCNPDLTLPNASEPEPDIAVVKPLGIVYSTQRHPYPQDIFWLIEFSDSSLVKDLRVKTATYADVGIQEYWVINLKAMELIVFRSPSPTGYQSKQTLSQGTLNPIAFPDVAISVDQLLGK